MKCKAVISTLFSVLLSVWYMAAIIGLDVHIDHHDGEIFVVSLLGRTDCESLHPEDVCHCVEHHHGHCNSQDEDCENEIGVITVTGDGYDFVCDFVQAPVIVPDVASVPASDFAAPLRVETVSFETPPRERLSNLCVLRV